MRTIQAGDIGGTNTRLAFFTVVEDRASLVYEERFASRGGRVPEVVGQFVSAHPFRVEVACRRGAETDVVPMPPLA